MAQTQYLLKISLISYARFRSLLEFDNNITKQQRVQQHFTGLFPAETTKPIIVLNEFCIHGPNVILVENFSNFSFSDFFSLLEFHDNITKQY